MPGRSTCRAPAALAWLALLLLPATASPAGEPPAAPPAPRAEELLSEQTVAALVVPNLGAAREAVGKLRLAEMLAQPEMQTFFQPPLKRMEQLYGEIRVKVHDVPALADHGQGLLDVSIPGNAKKARVIVGEADEEEMFELALGAVDPATELSGIQQRLMNLGYPCPAEKELGDGTRSAIRAFQLDRNIPETGELDYNTRQAIRDAHGS